MKASELRVMLNGLKYRHPDEDFELVIEVRESWIGPTPAVKVSSVYTGFDWDKGRLIIRPEKDLKLDAPK